MTVKCLSRLPARGSLLSATAPAASGAGQGAATFTRVDIAFQPTDVTIAANQDVTVTLVNNGAAMHNVSISDNQNSSVKNLSISVDVQPGQTQTVTINAPAGDYDFFCNVPDHEAAGIHGILHVK